MAETTARQVILAILIFAAVATGSFVFLSNFVPSSNTQYGQYNTTFNKFEEVKANSEALRANVNNADPKPGILGIVDGLVSTGWGTLQLVWTSLTAMTSMIGDLSSVYGLPLWFTGLLASILGVVIAFAIVAAIMKWYV